MTGVVGALPSSRVRDVGDVLASLLQLVQAQGLHWLTAAVSKLPDVAVTAADRDNFMARAVALVNGSGMDTEADDEAFIQGLEDLAELCRRNRRAQTAAQQALLPPELQSAVMVAT